MTTRGRPNGDAADTDTAPLTTLVARLTPGAPALVRQSIAAVPLRRASSGTSGDWCTCARWT